VALFVVLEGIDGSGKTSVAKAVHEALVGAGVAPRRLYVGEGLVEAAAQTRERDMPVQGRVEVRLIP